MSEKLCLQWNDFKENAIGAFGSLRDTTDFADVTLACEDGGEVDGWMDGWMRTSVLGSDPSLRIIHWPLIPPRSHWVQRFGQSDSSK